MARKPTGTEVVDWEKEMQAQAELAASAQRSSGGGGQFFSLKGGVLSFGENPMPGNQMAVVILADIMENSWYEGDYDPNVPASPKCFAFAKEEGELEPHEAVDNDPYFERQNDVCNGCIRNEWGSAKVGRGKACKNVMRIAMIPAGVFRPKGSGRNTTFELELYEDPSHFAKAEVAFMKLPVTSVKHYSKYVKQLAADLRRPPHGVITNIYLEPDEKSQYKVMFELVETLGNDILPAVMPRHKVEQASIDFPYQPPLEDEKQPAQKTNNKLRGKTGAKKAPARKR